MNNDIRIKECDKESRYLGIWIGGDLSWGKGMSLVFEKTAKQLETAASKISNTEDMITLINCKVIPSIMYSLVLMTPSKEQIETLEHIISLAARKTHLC